MLTDASPLAFALALAFTGEVKLRGCGGSLVCSAFGVSSALVSEPDPLAFAFACGFGFCSLAGAVGDAFGAEGAASFTESSDPVRSPAALPFAEACLSSPGRLANAGNEPGASGVVGACVEGAASFTASNDPARLPAASPFAVPLIPDSELLAEPAAFPAVLMVPARPLLPALEAALATPAAEPVADPLADEAVLWAESRAPDTWSRTRPVVSRVRSTAPDV